MLRVRYQIRSDQLLSCVRLFATPWTAARQASLSITNSWSSLRLTSIESVMPSSSCPQSLPASESFPISQLFPWGGQSTGVSALTSFLPKKSQDWPPSEWTGWISLKSKGLSRVFSNTTVQKHQFFGAQPSSQSNSHIHTWPQKPLDESESGEWKSWLKAQHSENEDHGIQSHHFMGNIWGNSGNSVRLYFSGLQNHCRWWLQPWN